MYLKTSLGIYLFLQHRRIAGAQTDHTNAKTTCTRSPFSAAIYSLSKHKRVFRIETATLP